jgi:hypothetical protein
MIKLDETELKLKEDLHVIFSGGYDSKLSKEQVEYCKEFSFLYNHIVFENRDIIFSYNNLNFKISNVPEEDIFLPNQMIKDQFLYQLRSSEEFKTSYKQFLRDYKIDKILQV